MGMTFRKTVIFGTAVLMGPWLAQAEESGAGLKSGKPLGEMVVTATRGEGEVKDAPAAVNVITEQEIGNRNIFTLDEAINTVPGVFVKRGKGVLETTPAMTLRGMPLQKRTLLMVDGVPQNDAYTGDVNFAAIDVENVERVEVVRGPFSSLYGGNAMGGVVNVITKMPARTGGNVKLRYGTAWDDGEAPENTTDLAVNADARASAALAVGVGYHRRASDGYPSQDVTQTFTSANLNSLATAGITGHRESKTATGATTYLIGDRGDNTWEEDHLGFKLKYAPSARTGVNFAVDRSTSEYGYGVPNTLLRNGSGAPVYSASSPLIREGSFLSGPGGNEQTSMGTSAAMAWGDLLGKLVLGYNDQNKNWFVTPASTSATRVGGIGTYTNTESNNASVDAQVEIPLRDNHLLTVGAALRRGEAHTRVHNLSNWKDVNSKTTLNNESQGEDRIYALFLQDAYFVTDKLTAYLGARQDWWSTEGSADIVGSAGFPRNYTARDVTAFSPKLALVFKPVEATAYRASIGKSFRAPTVFELYRTTLIGSTLFVANPELDPETALSWELGVDHTFGNDINLAATYFNNKMQDFIYRRAATADDPTRINQNAAEAESSGVELALKGKLAGGFAWWTNYTYTDTEITENAAVATSEGKRIPQVPKNMANLGLDWQRDRVTVSTAARYVSKRYNLDDNTDTQEGVQGAYDSYTLVDIKAGYRFTSKLRAAVGINNVLDKNYYDFYKAPGRMWFAEISASI